MGRRAAIVGVGLVLSGLLLGSAGATPERPRVPVVHLERSTALSEYLYALDIARFDSDGDRDIVGCRLAPHRIQLLSFFPNDGAGNFDEASAQDATFPGYCLELAAVTLNDDSIPDVAVVTQSSTAGEPARLRTLLGDGSGGFDEVGDYPLTAAAQGYSAGLAVGDFDGDANFDVVVNEPRADVLDVFLGKGDGTLADPTMEPVGRYPFDVAAGDIDGDGFDDVVSADFKSSRLTVLRGAPEESDMVKSTIREAREPSDVLIADIKGDPIDDLVASSAIRTRGSVEVFRGREGRLPERVWTQKIYTAPGVLAAGDFNEDRIPDLVVGARLGVGVFFGRPGKGFVHPTLFGLSKAANRAEEILVGDLDGRDPRADLLATTGRVNRFLVADYLSRCHGRIATVVGSPGDDSLGADWIPDASQVTQGGAGGDIFLGSDGRDIACYGSGRDVGGGDSGRDLLLAGGGDDFLIYGSGGADKIVGGSGDDELGDNHFGGERDAGDDTFIGGGGDDEIDGGRGHDRCDGGPGRDTASHCAVTRRIP